MKQTFSGCEALTDVTLPAGVRPIPKSAFKGCTELTIHAPAGSYAEQFAQKNGIPFQAV